MFYIVYSYRPHKVLFYQNDKIDIQDKEYIEWADNISKHVTIKESGIFIL